MRKRLAALCVSVILALIGFCAIAIADADPIGGKLTKIEAKDAAIAFLARKCGVDEEALQGGKWSCTLKKGDSVGTFTRTPHWYIYVYDIPGHNGLHIMELSTQGQLLYWTAHGNQGYREALPDLLTEARQAEPLEGYPQEADIIKAMTGALEDGGYTAKELEGLSYQAHYIYTEQIHDGNVPVWLVYASRDGVVKYKALYDYRGDAMSVVPWEMDFLCYKIQGEQFWEAGTEIGLKGDETWLLAEIVEGKMPLDERVEFTKRLRPCVERWMETHPYYQNYAGMEYYYTFLNICGIPDEKSISQEEALRITEDEAVRMGCPKKKPDKRQRIVSYYITDPENPIWEIQICSLPLKYRGGSETDAMNYWIRIHAYTGDIMQSSAAEKRRGQ